ncbi:hypothetical protein DIPPA_20404 [Diplonema papillatum]|nr:hypothetical protein DIPPA_20404 [Diplonema papillatum]
MVIGNFLLTAGFAAVSFLVLSAGRHFRAVTSFSCLHNLDIQGFLRLPSLPLLVFTLLYQGSALGSMALIYDPPSAVAFTVGLCSVVLCIVVPLLVFCEVGKGVPSLAFFKDDDRYTGFGWRFMIGKGEWVSTTPDVHYAHRFQSVLTVYSEDKAWCGYLRFGSSFALAALSAPVTVDYVYCGHVKLCSALVVLIELAAMIRVWPYAKPRDALADMVTSLLEAGGMLLMAAGFYADDPYHWTHGMAAVLLTVAVLSVGVWVLFDLATEAFVFFTSRRVRLQESVYAGAQSGGAAARGKEKSMSISVQLPDHSDGGTELSPRPSMFSTEASPRKLGASARQQSCASSSPSDYMFLTQADDTLLSPTLSHASVHGDGMLNSSLRSTFRTSPNHRFASRGSPSLLLPAASPEPHLHGPATQLLPLDERRRSSFLSPRASPELPQPPRNFASSGVPPRGMSPLLGESELRSPKRRPRLQQLAPLDTRQRHRMTRLPERDLLGLTWSVRHRGSPELFRNYERSRTSF